MAAWAGNALTIALLRDLTPVHLSFLAWTEYALPLVAILLPVPWRVLMSIYPPEIGSLDLSTFRSELREMGPLSSGERRVAAVFGLTVALWAIEPLAAVPPDWTSMVALFSAIALSLPGVGVLTWTDIHRHTGWHIFLLVGGGLALGTGLVATGAVAWVADVVISHVDGLHMALVLALISAATAAAIVVFCTISGTATTLVPLAVGLALSAGWNPLPFALAAGLSSSFAFLLPASSAPNALAYGSGYFTSADMVRAGLLLMALSVLALAVMASTLWQVLAPVLG